MLRALPGVTARRLAGRIDAVAGGMGALADPCRVAAAGALASAPQAGLALALEAVAMGAAVDRRDPGQALAVPFTAQAMLVLIGPDPGPDPDPGIDAAAPADLMLALALDALLAEGEGAADADRAAWSGGGRRLRAWWRATAAGSATPGADGARARWQVPLTFEGALSLSPDPAQGGAILRVLVDARAPDRAQSVTLSGPAEALPLHAFVGIDAGAARRLAAEGLVRAGDLLAIPEGAAAGRLAALAAGAPGVEAALLRLHATLRLRRDIVAAGLNAGALPAAQAAATADTAWDGAAPVPPPGLSGAPLLRWQLLGRPLLGLLRDDARARVTLGQLATSAEEG